MMNIPILAMVNRLSIEHEVKGETVRGLAASLIFSVIMREINPRISAMMELSSISMFAVLAPQLNINEPKAAALIRDTMKEIEKILAL
jgi:hypothetical protein